MTDTNGDVIFEETEFMGIKIKIYPECELPEGMIALIKGQRFQNPDGTWNENEVYLIDSEKHTDPEAFLEAGR